MLRAVAGIKFEIGLKSSNICYSMFYYDTVNIGLHN